MSEATLFWVQLLLYCLDNIKCDVTVLWEADHVYHSSLYSPKSRKLSWRGKCVYIIYTLHVVFKYRIICNTQSKSTRTRQSHWHITIPILVISGKSSDILHWDNTSMSERISVLPLPKRITPATSAASKRIKVRTGYWDFENILGADRILRLICTESVSFWDEF